jgi:hypothetical protein
MKSNPQKFIANAEVLLEGIGSNSLLYNAEQLNDSVEPIESFQIVGRFVDFSPSQCIVEERYSYF